MTSVIGTWRLVKGVSRDADGRELPAPYGGNPMGRVVLGADGRMVAVICDARPEIPDGGKREYASYCGNYTFDGATLSTRVDASSDQSRIGGDQMRSVRFENGAMVLAPPRRLYAGVMQHQELVWERIDK